MSAKSTRICKVCGIEYPYCRTARDEGLFRWQDVACCAEHGSQYFAEVLASREGKSVPTESVPTVAKKAPSKKNKKSGKLNNEK